MANINFQVQALVCQAPELLYVSTGFSAGQSDATFQLRWDSIGQYYQQNVDPTTVIRLTYNYQDGNGWQTYGSTIPFSSLTDYPIQIPVNIGYLVVQFRLELEVRSSDCGVMYSNVLTNTYT